MPAPSMIDVVAAAQKGDLAAFDSLVEALGRDLRVFVASRAVDREQLEEVCQATWVAAWKGLAAWRPEAPFDHWLRGIARNVLMQDAAQRARRRRSEGEEALAQAMAEDSRARSDEPDPRLARLPRCLERLAPRSRTILLARDAQGETLTSLARRFKQPRATLATALWRIRQTVRACLEEARS